MAAPSEKLAASLAVLHSLQADGRRVFKSDQFTRVHRERLPMAIPRQVVVYTPKGSNNAIDLLRTGTLTHPP
jgi:hypothetical protein